MEKIIMFNTGNEEVTLKVVSCFAYTYNESRTVLKLSINESDHEYSDIKKLKNNKGVIRYYEDNTLKAEYEGYTLGKDGFYPSCTGDVWNVEILQKDAKNVRIDTAFAAILGLSAEIEEIWAILEEKGLLE